NRFDRGSCHCCPSMAGASVSEFEYVFRFPPLFHTTVWPDQVQDFAGNDVFPFIMRVVEIGIVAHCPNSCWARLLKVLRAAIRVRVGCPPYQCVPAHPTGMRGDYDFILNSAAPGLNAQGAIRPSEDEAAFFVGLIRPRPGVLPGLSEDTQDGG